MTDYATEENGARIALATSSDSRHPPENVLSSKENCFWTTTGMFPQEIIITLKGKLEVTKIKLSTTSVKKVIVERTEGPQPSKFEKLFEVELQDKGNRMQTESHQVGNIPAKHLKLILVSAWDDFATVHKVIVEGVPIKSSKDKDASGGNAGGREPADAAATTPKPSSSVRSSSTERRERTSDSTRSGADASGKDEARAAPSPKPVRVPSARLGRSASRGSSEIRDIPVEVRTPKGPAPGTPTKELRPPPQRESSREESHSRERRPSDREDRAGDSGRERGGESGREKSRGSRKEKEDAGGEEDDEFNF
eukprot:jgi/Mesvir1/13693/Mv02126-RA.1